MFTSRECSKCFGKTADELFQLAIESRRTLTSHELRTSPEGGKRSAPPLSCAEAGALPLLSQLAAIPGQNRGELVTQLSQTKPQLNFGL